MAKFTHIMVLLLLYTILLLHIGCRKSPSQTEGMKTDQEITFQENQVHIGTVYAELAPFKTLFHFSNSTNSEIELNAKSCCGVSITFKDDKKVYAPDEKGEVTFEILSIPKSHHGFFKKTATISRKGDGEFIARLTVTADVKRKCHIFPTELKFGKIKPGQTLTEKLEIESGTEEQLQVVNLSESLPPFIKVDQIAKTNSKGIIGYKYAVSLTGDGKKRLIDETISFETNSSTIPIVTIPVQAEMIESVIIEPQSLFFGKVLPGASVSKSINISSTCEELLSVQNVSSTPNNVQLTEVSQSKDFHSIDLSLLFSSTPKTSGIVRGFLTIITNRTLEGSEYPLEYKVPWVVFIDP